MLTKCNAENPEKVCLNKKKGSRLALLSHHAAISELLNLIFVIAWTEFVPALLDHDSDSRFSWKILDFRRVSLATKVVHREDLWPPILRLRIEVDLSPYRQSSEA